MWGEFGGLSEHTNATVTDSSSGPLSDTGDLAAESRRYNGERLFIRQDSRVVAAAAGPWHMIILCKGGRSDNDTGDIVIKDGNARVEPTAQEEQDDSAGKEKK